jgi:hypothetical protein
LTVLRFAELATAVIVIWVILGGWAFLDTLTACSRHERLSSLGWSAFFGALAVGVVWGLAWAAAKARAGT